jgi:hypothetical protein
MGGEGGAGGEGGPTWGTYSIELLIDAGLQGQILQIGFVNTASNFEGSGIFYDNVVATLDDGAGGSGGDLVYEQDFESLDADIAAALGDDGWLFFANVFDGTQDPPAFKFPYGPFPAPNATVSPTDTFISAVVSGEGGPTQGEQQLSVFSDYNCCDLALPTPQGHGNGTDLVEINVFQEIDPIPGSYVGKTLTFNLEAKRGNIEGATTAFAFIKTLDPNAGFATTNFVTVEMTNIQ